MRFLICVEPIFILYNPTVNDTDRSILPWKNEIGHSLSLLLRMRIMFTKAMVKAYSIKPTHCENEG